ncbi:YbaK/EbsC family protein [Azospirillum sp. TSO35-2]|uniref:YbaK/EbsC family protein n=1 Tax=Azospirillum sp. TSO35-2 TaxID=716796 RepID=UPI000D608E4E|nr:YbaK/EbsC family protein [Azospirillum sp. TSO35-2]PWC39705.1 prolyl-tRNA synthetase [Azospirillum sp. TSO35-2]
MTKPLSPSAQRVQTLLDSIGLGHRVVEHEGSTRTSDDAAAAVGCTVAQIAKSLIFRAKTSGQPVLVIASGANRVDEKAVGRLIGEKIERADPEFVRESTGYAIGGVSPIGHAVPPLVLIDDDLMRLETIWAAAGTPNAVFRLTPADLVSMTGGRVESVRKA